MKFSDFRWCYSDKPKDKRKFYERILPDIRRRARKLGYAIGLHGSMRRDLDLIAVPWRGTVARPEALAYSLWSAVTKRKMVGGNWRLAKSEKRWHGRLGFVLPVGKTAYIDLAVMPPVKERKAT